MNDFMNDFMNDWVFQALNIAHKCHVFKCDSHDTAEQISKSVAQAFKVADDGTIPNHADMAPPSVSTYRPQGLLKVPTKRRGHRRAASDGSIINVIQRSSALGYGAQTSSRPNSGNFSPRERLTINSMSPSRASSDVQSKGSNSSTGMPIIHQIGLSFCTKESGFERWDPAPKVLGAKHISNPDFESRCCAIFICKL